MSDLEIMSEKSELQIEDLSM